MALNHAPRMVTANLVGFWDALHPGSYPGSGTTWYDISGNDNHATMMRTPLGYLANGAFTFNGNGYFSIANNADWKLAGDATVCLWSNNAINGNVIKYQGGSWTQWWLNNRAVSYNGNTIGGGECNMNLGAAASDGVWSMATFVIDRTAGFYYLYNNNANNRQSAVITSPALTVTSNLYFGARGDVPDSFTPTGAIGQVMIYNKALSNAEIIQNYNIFKGRYGL